MRIPSGDLAPARKRRRGYSARRRRRNPLPIVLAVLLVAAVALGTYWLRRDNGTTGTTDAGARCPSVAPSVAASTPAAVTPPARATPVRLPAPGQVSLRLLNGTGRAKLALTVGNELARRGFRVAGFTNAPRPLVGASRVYFGPGGRPAALLVSAHLLGSQIVPVPTAGRGAVEAVLGSTFVRLRTPPEVSAYARQLAAGAAPAAPKPASPAPSASPACRT